MARAFHAANQTNPQTFKQHKRTAKEYDFYETFLDFLLIIKVILKASAILNNVISIVQLKYKEKNYL